MADIATELGLPFYVYFPTNAGFLSFMLYLATHPEKLDESSDSELIIPGFVNPVPTSVLPQGVFTEEAFPIYIKLAPKFRNVDGILINTVSELEPHAIASFSSSLNPPVYTVGPLLDTKGQINPNIDQDQYPEILKWLDAQPEASVVYLCFGNGGIFHPAQVNEIATGLELSGQKFLWSLQVSDPEFEFPEEFLKRVSGKGVICKWSPQGEVLSHKAIGGFVSHCGWNSILESLWFGVPIVTWPLYAEQQLNAFGMVKELDLALEMRLDSRRDGGDIVMADEIARAVGSVMDNGCLFRKKVKETSDNFKKCLMEGGSSFVSVRGFIDANFSL